MAADISILPEIKEAVFTDSNGNAGVLRISKSQAISLSDATDDLESDVTKGTAATPKAVAIVKSELDTTNATVTEIQGNVTEIQGTVTEIQGSVTEIQGSVNEIQDQIESGEIGGGGTAASTVRTPTNLSPAGTNVDIAPLFKADPYACQIATDARAYREFQIAAKTGSYDKPVKTKQINEDTWQYDSTLDPNTEYKWRVRDVSAWGAVSAWASAEFKTIESAGIVTPTMTVQGSPSDVPEDPILTGSAFSTIGVSTTHKSTDWQVVKKSDQSVVWEVDNDGSNLTSIQMPKEKLDVLTEYEFKVRYHGANDLTSEWGSATATTKAEFAFVVTPTVTIATGTTNVQATPTFTASEPALNEGKINHTKTDWIITESNNPQVETWSSKDDTVNLTSITVPSGKLKVSKTYTLKVRYYDATLDAWSNYGSVEFTTAKEFIVLAKPTLELNCDKADNVPNNPVFTSSAFTATAGSKIAQHKATNWILYTNPDEGEREIIWKSLNDEENLDVCITETDFKPRSKYVMTCQYIDASGAVSEVAELEFFSSFEQDLDGWLEYQISASTTDTNTITVISATSANYLDWGVFGLLGGTTISRDIGLEQIETFCREYLNNNFEVKVNGSAAYLTTERVYVGDGRNTAYVRAKIDPSAPTTISVHKKKRSTPFPVVSLPRTPQESDIYIVRPIPKGVNYTVDASGDITNISEPQIYQGDLEFLGGNHNVSAITSNVIAPFKNYKKAQLQQLRTYYPINPTEKFLKYYFYGVGSITELEFYINPTISSGIHIRHKKTLFKYVPNLTYLHGLGDTETAHVNHSVDVDEDLFEAVPLLQTMYAVLASIKIDNLPPNLFKPLTKLVTLSEVFRRVQFTGEQEVVEMHLTAKNITTVVNFLPPLDGKTLNIYVPLGSTTEISLKNCLEGRENYNVIPE